MADISVSEKTGALGQCNKIAQSNQQLSSLNNVTLKNLVNRLDDVWDSDVDERKAITDLKEQIAALAQLTEGIVSSVNALRNYINSIETIEEGRVE